MNVFICSYMFKGAKWSFDIHADSFEEAADKLRWLKMNAVLDGELMLSIAVPTWWSKLHAAVRNLTHQSLGR